MLIPSFLIQVIGFIGILFFVISFQQKSRSGILVFIIIGQVFFLIHYVLLGAWTAAGMNFVGAGRTLVFRLREEKRWANRRYWPAVFIILFGIAGLVAQESWIGFLPVIAMTIETTGFWMKDTRTLRLISLFPHPFWFIYNIIKGSWAGVVSEIFVLSSVIIAIFRYDVKSTRAKDLRR